MEYIEFERMRNMLRLFDNDKIIKFTTSAIMDNTDIYRKLHGFIETQMGLLDFESAYKFTYQSLLYLTQLSATTGKGDMIKLDDCYDKFSDFKSIIPYHETELARWLSLSDNNIKYMGKALTLKTGNNGYSAYGLLTKSYEMALQQCYIRLLKLLSEVWKNMSDIEKDTNIVFLTKNDFEAYNFISVLGDKTYSYTIRCVKDTFNIERKEIDMKIDKKELKLTQQKVLIIPTLTHKYVNTLFLDEKDIFYSLFIWYSDTEAILLHDNTGWSQIPYFKRYNILENVESSKKIPKEYNIIGNIEKSKRIFLDIKGGFYQYNSIDEYIANILDLLYRYYSPSILMDNQE